MRAAERQVLEVARETVEVLARPEAAEFHIQRAVEVLLFEPHLGQAPGLAASPHFLHRAELPGAWVADAVVGQVATASLGDGQFEFGIVPAEDLLQVQVRTQGELVAVAGGLVVVVATVEVAGHFANVIDGEVVAFFQQLGAGAAPITGHPFRLAGESFGSLQASTDGHRQRRKQRQ